MMTFHDIATPWQIGLLVFSMVTMVILVADAILSGFYRSKTVNLPLSLALFLVNASVYVIMQLDSRLTEQEADGHLHIPYILLLLMTAISFALAVWVLIRQTRGRRTLNRASIKEAFDELPTGVCFFSEEGLPVLCNLAMQRFSFAVCGRDVQFVTDLEELLQPGFVPAEAVSRDGAAFTLADGKVIQLEKRKLSYENGEQYIQFVATDITKLHQSRVELTAENEQLRKVQEELKRLSASVVTVTREEEIMNTKMRVHDDMGRCLMAAQKCLKEQGSDMPTDMIDAWHRAVSMLKYNNETSEEEMLAQIRKTCRFVNLELICRGALPGQENAAYLLTCALRECVTNAVRYAYATELYADFSESEEEATVVVTNNGKIPEGDIVEGGGLSTLRRRVERAGGTMRVDARPSFRLTVTVPKEREGIL